jgi:hypothetical protein
VQWQSHIVSGPYNKLLTVNISAMVALYNELKHVLDANNVPQVVLSFYL